MQYTIYHTPALGYLPVPVHIDTGDFEVMAVDRDKIAEAAVTSTIYWNDVDCYYWMYDFPINCKWCEMAQPQDVSPWDELFIRIYADR